MSSSPDSTAAITVVLGATTPPGRLRRALEEAIDRRQQDGGQTDLLDLAEQRLSFADGRPPGELGDDTEAVIAAVAAAEALVVATPVYRGSLTGSLKNLFDLLPVDSLQGKAVGLVAMGASDHHYLGAERHLRDVLAFFGAWALPVAVYLNSADFDEGAPGERAATALDQLLAGVATAARALGETDGPAGPAPLSARAIRPRDPARAS
jgi:FMN reductase